MSRTILFATAILTSLLMLPAVNAVAQNAQAAAPQATPLQTEEDLGIMKELTEQSERLRSETEGRLNVLREKQGVSDTILQDVRSAQQFTEELMTLLQEAARGLEPDSAYLKTLQAQEEIARGLAGEALASQKPADRAFSETFTAQAAAIAAMIAEARDIGAKLAAQVALLNDRKSQIRFAYAAGKIAQFIRNARESLDIYREILTGASDLARRSGQINPHLVPSQ